MYGHRYSSTTDNAAFLLRTMDNAKDEKKNVETRSPLFQRDILFFIQRIIRYKKEKEKIREREKEIEKDRTRHAQKNE